VVGALKRRHGMIRKHSIQTSNGTSHSPFRVRTGWNVGAAKSCRLTGDRSVAPSYGGDVFEEFHLPISLVVVDSFRVSGASGLRCWCAAREVNTHSIKRWPGRQTSSPTRFRPGGSDRQTRVRDDLSNLSAELSNAAKQSPVFAGWLKSARPDKSLNDRSVYVGARLTECVRQRVARFATDSEALWSWFNVGWKLAQDLNIR